MLNAALIGSCAVRAMTAGATDVPAAYFVNLGKVSELS
jgi:hypothetical protein